MTTDADVPPDLPAGFYVDDGGGAFTPTRATESPWDRDAQHGGPPSALLAYAMRTLDPRPPLRLARLTVEFLGTIPRSPLTVEARVIRPGRRIRLLEAAMRVDGRDVALARAWEIAANGAADGAADRPRAAGPAGGAGRTGAEDRADAADPAALAEGTALPPPQPQRYFPGLTRWGYGEAIEWRWVSGAYDLLGEGSVWTRTRIPLIVGGPADPVDGALIVADSANGISGALPHDEWLFVPPTITVTLHRHPASEWVRLDARTTLTSDGLGSTAGTLADRDGPLGTVAQPLLVSRRA